MTVIVIALGILSLTLRTECPGRLDVRLALGSGAAAAGPAGATAGGTAGGTVGGTAGATAPVEGKEEACTGRS